jgi:hypothetical protein
MLCIRMQCTAECECTEECNCEKRVCWKPCCVEIPCRNYHLCQGTTLQWSQKRLCFLCSIQLGKHIFIRRLRDCPLCEDYTYMYQMSCKHIVCNDCLYRETKASCTQCELGL